MPLPRNTVVLERFGFDIWPEGLQVTFLPIPCQPAGAGREQLLGDWANAGEGFARWWLCVIKGIKGLGATSCQLLHRAGPARPGARQMGIGNAPRVESNLVNISLQDHLQSSEM